MAEGWEIIIGLEVHAQVISVSKLFSPGSTEFGAEPNSQVTLIDAAMPGMLPVLNQECVRQAVRTGIAVGGRINLFSQFERKNYFYPDLPQGYQISQFRHPLVSGGKITIENEAGEEKDITLERIHIEQDAGKLLHDQDSTQSYVDLNRCGIALMEIVTLPDMRSAGEASAFVAKLRSLLRYIGSCDGNMQEGSLRVDANVSLRRVGAALGTRCEIKNLNSLRFLRQAIDFEVVRQSGILEEGGKIIQETRLFDSIKNTTRSMRDKEEAHDYRYFPEPDLPPLLLKQEEVDSLKGTLPELPEARKQRFLKEYQLGHEETSILIAEKARADYFEHVAKMGDARLSANWVASELLGRINKAGLSINESPVVAKDLCALLMMIKDGDVSNRAAKDVLDVMFEEGGKAEEIIDRLGLRQVNDSAEIERLAKEIIEENPGQCEAYREGKTKLIGWFVGQIMQRSKGKANPAQAGEILKKALGS